MRDRGAASKRKKRYDITDVHCHILPGVDDGAESMNEALKLLRMEYHQGVRTVILTPHYRKEFFETDRKKVTERYRELQKRLGNIGIDIQLHLGCEFHRQDEMIREIQKDPAYTMGGSKYILVEFSHLDEEEIIFRQVTDLIAHGYRPIIAHVERYPAVRSLQQVKRLMDVGAYIQVNAGSVLGLEGFGQKRFCKKLLKAGYVHLIGSDAHDLRRRYPCMDKCQEYLSKKIGIEKTRKIMSENPGRILVNESIA